MRSLLVAAFAALVAACGVQGTPDELVSPVPEGTPRSPTVPVRPDPGELEEREAESWGPVEGEVEVDLKRSAAEVSRRLLTYAAGSAPEEVVRSAVGRVDDATVRAASPLVETSRSSTGEVVYPQLGGLDGDRASVMVVLRQTLEDGAGVRDVTTRTLDLRMRRDGTHWRFHELASAGGDPVPRPDDIDPRAAAVLDHPAIWLPDSARWDIHRGEVHPVLLETMAALAERTEYAVTVIASGHPVHVFGSDRRSNHARGRAVDIHEVGGRAVVTAERGGPAHEAVRWLHAEAGVSELGSPWDLDGAGGRSFSDVLHRDHVHIGFDPTGG